MPHADSEVARATGDGFPVPGYGPYAQRDWPQAEKGYAAAVSFLDRDVGRVLDALSELGIAGNTLVLFTSDNGPATVGGHSHQFFRSAGPYRGRKGQLYEGGIRVPAIARWPGRIPAGAVSRAIWNFADFLPLAAELARLEPPRGLDGVSILPLLLGGERRQAPEYLYWEAHGAKHFAQAVRVGRWKAIRPAGRSGPLELYDLEADPSESRDLAAKERAVARRLAGLLDSVRTESPDYPAV